MLDWILANVQISPWAINSSSVPCSTRRPSSKTKSRSAPQSVESLWEMKIAVRRRVQLRTVLRMARLDSASTLEVALSRIRMAG